MTANRRIVLNIVATYGRSLFNLACGLFTARWVLMALGQEDFGLYGVVGGLAIFISFFNMLLSMSLGRHYAFSIGEAKRYAAEGRADEGLENCRRWFNTALSVYVVIPIILTIIGYPIGEWAVRHFLAIPADKIETCVWVFRLTCVSVFLGMVTVPYNAMYGAKQYIAEITVYSVVQTALNMVFFYYMSVHPGNWLLGYAIWMCAMSVLMPVVISWRASVMFPECRIRFSYWLDLKRVRSLAIYAWWQMFGGLGYVCRAHGMAILVNKYFGARVNAAMNVASSVSGQTQTLVAAMSGAFQPAIVTAYGVGDHETVRKMSFRASKFGVVLTLIFLIPLALELPEVLHLWLNDPPPFTTGLCWCMMAILLVDKASLGHQLACNASGRIAAYQTCGGVLLILSLPLAWCFLACGFNVYVVGVAMLVTTAFNTVNRVHFAQRIVGLSVRQWAVEIVMPVLLVSVLSSLPGFIIVHCARPAFSRVCLTTVVSELMLFPLIWWAVLDAEEKRFVCAKILLVKEKFTHG